ncbi:MAG TPA: DUF1841 family protein [Paenalcaligenes hominis]|uniref:DUF1841 family protein n=1 Tax=Paenalcaligenes hominis TaxID=643674 RepID=A0A9D2VI03_9BURK|nr:DUF1841 family protein [Paenalcaligenes hominis]NJB66306.1 hypothetical protein [Paenalcaligenes hominis]GGE74845.1 hypothetical protein GCM10007278_23790 [Paenalcaligenes hominis]HJH24885.1 DUF1841 family protein [Paenalcaligenes hominis]
MFNPSRDQVRQFFIEAWSKYRQKQLLSPLENMAVNLVQQHPEYHDLLASPEATHHEFSVEKGQTNPFLHLSMHLAIQEQLSIDQPPGIKQAYDRLVATLDPHEATHRIMDALGEIIWEAQRLNKPLDNERYIELIHRYANI